MKERNLPKQCINRKAAYKPLTKWWCTFCAPTGGRICSPICKRMGNIELKK